MPYEDSFTTLYGGLRQMADAQEKRDEETKNRAREFKALQEYADATGYADKNTTTTMDLDALKGLVRGSEAKRIQSEHEERLGFERRRVNLAELARTDAENQWAAGAPGRNAMVDYHNQLTQSSKAAEQSRMAGLAEQGRQQGRLTAFNQDLAGQTAGPGMRALADYANGDMLGGARPDLGALAGMAGQGFREQALTPQIVADVAARHGQALNPQLDNLMNSLGRAGGAGGAGLKPEWRFNQAEHVVPLGKDLPGHYYVETGPHQGQIIKPPNVASDLSEPQRQSLLAKAHLEVSKLIGAAAKILPNDPDRGAKLRNLNAQVAEARQRVADLNETGGETAPAAPDPAPAAQTMAEQANALARQHPDWTREQIINAVRSRR